MLKKETSQWWWFDSHHRSPGRSLWLQSTLGELDKKTQAMLKLIEQDADSFAQRAEMYYKKRPELISMVEDFYRAHRSLAERYDQLKSDSGNRLLTTLGSPFSAGYQRENLIGVMDQTCYNYSNTYGNRSDAHENPSDTDDPDERAESEVDDPEQDDETHVDKQMEEVEEPDKEEETRSDKDRSKVEVCEEVMTLRDEIERLKDENRIQNDQLLQKDEEKREVIRQLSLAVELLKLENVNLRTRVARASPNKKSTFAFQQLKDVFSGRRLFNGSPKFQGTVVAL